MSRAKYNPFTRGVLLAGSVLMLSLAIYIGKTAGLTLSADSHRLAHRTVNTAFPENAIRLTGLSGRQNLGGIHLPSRGAILTGYRVETRQVGKNATVVTITQTYRLPNKAHPAIRRNLFARVGSHVAHFTSNLKGKLSLLNPILSAKTG